MYFAISEIAKRKGQTYTKPKMQRKSTFFAKKPLKSFVRVEKVRTFATVKRTQGPNAKEILYPTTSAHWHIDTLKPRVGTGKTCNKNG